MSLTYNSLVSAIQTYVEDSGEEFISQLPTIITNSCLAIVKEVDAVGLNVTVTVSASTGNPIVLLPDACYVIKTVAKTSAGRKKFLKHRSYDYLIESWPDVTSVKGNPTSYNRLNDTQLYVTPTPAIDQPIEIRMVTVSIPSSDNQTSYLLDRYPDLTLYRCLVEANLLKMNPDDAKSWADMYTNTKTQVENEARRNRRDDGFTPIAGPISENTLKGTK